MLEQLEAALPQTDTDGEARRAALSAGRERLASAAATNLVGYDSHGRLLVIGSGQRIAGILSRLNGFPEGVILDTGPPGRLESAAELPAQGHWFHLQGSVESLQGFLGRFSAQVSTPQGAQDLAQVFGDGRPYFDLVLDLAEKPVLDQEQPPFGYFRQPQEESLEQTLQALRDMVGHFEKPTYFQYQADICAHGRNGIEGCRRCIDSCPTGAIHSLGEQIEVDSHLCQGAGSCATACPSGAIRYAYPGLQDSLEALREMLKSYRKHGGRQATILFHDCGPGGEWVLAQAAGLPQTLIPFPLEEAASVGMETWLSCLAYGAARVVVLTPPQLAAAVRRELGHQIAIAQALLQAMGYPSDALQVLDTADQQALGAVSSAAAPRDPISPADYAAFDEKRTMAYLAIEHLHAQAARAKPVVNLPAGAPFGTAEVDGRTCTLCLACVSACPGKALLDTPDFPRLRFIEANCLQCGMCTRTCPEDAIWIAPRYLFDAAARRRPRVLHEEEPAFCISCGKPFGTRKMLESMRGKLQGHWMYQDAANLRRLEMCEDCRVKDLFAAGPGKPDNLGKVQG